MLYLKLFNEWPLIRWSGNRHICI